MNSTLLPRSLSLPLACLVLSACVSTTIPAPGPRDLEAPSLELEATIPVDPQVVKGRLPNGLTYYVRENRQPEARAELRLIVNAGSILEDADQLGLAHFLEHMAFNGTRRFRRQELVDYLESIGLRFGPDLNAYTNYDATVYLLQVPTDTPAVLKRAFEILEDWAHGMRLEEQEIERERGVVIEEWRLGRGASARIFDQQVPVLFKDSIYAERPPIGNKETLESFAPDALRRFYRQWYRPDLMAVVAVGDFDAAEIERLVQKHFSRLKGPARPRPRPTGTVPDHADTLFAIATDPELTQTSLSVAYKYDPAPETKVKDYRRSLLESIYHRMLNDRLAEKTRQAEPPFLGASSSQGRFVRSKEAYVLSASVEDGGLVRGLEALLTEAERARRHGFEESELSRQKADYLRAMARLYEERQKTGSAIFAAEYGRSFLEGEPIPGIEYEYRLAQRYLPALELQEIDALADRWITDQNRVILISAPEKQEHPMPTEEALLAVFRQVADQEIAPFVDRVTDQPLVATPPERAPIVSRRTIEALEVHEWELANGVRVVLKPTDFKNDEILFTAFSPGGHSLVSNEDHIAAMTATSVVAQGGVADLDLIQLDKLLAGKVVQVAPFLGELSEGFSGGGSPADLETLFQLIYLYFTAPRSDETAFLSYQTRMRGALTNRSAQPGVVFGDRILEILSQNHPRRRPFTVEQVDAMDLRRSHEIFRDRFADASDFTFVFVGSFDLQMMEPLVESYLGGLPGSGRVETWRDVGVEPPRGVIEETVNRGLEAKSQVVIIFTGPFTWSRQNRYDLRTMAALLRLRLRQTLREELGGTYGVSVSSSSSKYPDQMYNLSINFSCAPDKVEELAQAVFAEIAALRTHDADLADVAKIQESQRRSRETALTTNSFWLSTLRFSYYYGEDAQDAMRFDELVENLSAQDLRQAATNYLDTDHYVKVVLMPEESAEPSLD